MGHHSSWHNFACASFPTVAAVACFEDSLFHCSEVSSTLAFEWLAEALDNPFHSTSTELVLAEELLVLGSLSLVALKGLALEEVL